MSSASAHMPPTAMTLPFNIRVIELPSSYRLQRDDVGILFNSAG
jgi:hypothetical protein